MNLPIKYAAVGTGGRIPMFIDPIVDRFSGSATLVGLCDPSATRRNYHQQRLASQYGIDPVPVYEDFDRMLREQRPNTVIVCTPDNLHHEFIVRSLEFGADVISEKPLTIDAEKFRQIQDAVERTGKSVRTTFNMRWAPGVTKVRQLIAEGTIGQIKHIDFEYLLNTSHGADYFRRWHSQKEISGGLLLHKSTHHFDILNWWLDGIPKTVYAIGDLVFYGKKNALERGEEHLTTYDRYTGNSASESDLFRLTIDDNPAMRGLYYDAEAESGYIRDRNVFREGIDIEDSLSVLVKYRTGPMVTYSLNAYSPNEGFRASISGDRGRIIYEEQHASHVVTGDAEIKTTGDHTMNLRVQNLFSDSYEVPIVKAEGGHGGGDPLIQEQMFSADPPPDHLNRNAGHEQGAASLLIGAAANRSIETGLPVKIDDIASLRPSASFLHELT